MRKVYNVSYDLNKVGKDYTGLHAELKKTYEWNHLLGSTWLLYTSETPDEIWLRLSPHVDKDDFMLIVQIVNNKQGWLSQAAWKWLNERLTGVLT